MSDFKIEIYKKLDDKIIFNGVQKDENDKTIGYMFIDRLTRSSFLIKNTESDYETAILDRLTELKKAFEEALCNTIR